MDVLVVAGAFVAGLALIALLGLLRSRRARPPQPWTVSEKLQLAGICVTLALGIAGIVVPTATDGPRLADVRVSLAESHLNPTGRDDSAAEYVCLVNEDSQAVALTGWTVRSSERIVNVLPQHTLERGEVVRVHAGAGTQTEGDVYGAGGRPAWRNEGGTVALFDDKRREIDSQAYGVRDDGDGDGACGRALAIALRVTSPANGAIVDSRTVVVRGTVTPGATVAAELDHDNESDFVGGRQARIRHLDGRDEFAVRVALRPGENSIRVGGRLPGAEPVLEFVGVVRRAEPEREAEPEPEPPEPEPEPPEPEPPETTTPAEPAPRCDANYAGACLPPDAADVDCSAIPDRNFRSTGSDPYGLDRDGNGIACEE